MATIVWHTEKQPNLKLKTRPGFQPVVSVMTANAWHTQKQPNLKMKTRPGFQPVGQDCKWREPHSGLS